MYNIERILIVWENVKNLFVTLSIYNFITKMSQNSVKTCVIEREIYIKEKCK